ncbi:MAG: alkaline phosphatase PhoX [Thermoleophilaceae bacterium]
MRRRDFIRGSAIAAGTLSFNPTFLRGAFARQAVPGSSHYGPLGSPDANGLRLPEGFSSRLIAQHSLPVLPTSYLLPVLPDGTAVYAQPDGGWIMAVNCESPVPGDGGASAIRFDKDGQVVDAYRILDGTQSNCSGGSTPWNTWLSCEEHDEGRVWECDIFGQRPAVELPALGTFSHEAACVDPIGKRVYITEDEGDSGFYRFTPDSYPDLTKGLLEVAVVDPNGLVEWKPVPDPDATTTPTRKQVPEMTQFRRGEGLYFEYPFAYVTTTSDSKIHAYNVITETLEVLWAGDAVEGESPAFDIDQLTYSDGGEIFVCEDEGLLRISILSADGRVMAPFLQCDGPEHDGAPELGNETTGVVFDPPGTRMYFSAQRSFGLGAVYEVTGPFRREKVDLREPTLRVEAPEAIRLGMLRRGGLPVTVVSDERCTVKASIRVPGSPAMTLARKRTTVKRGEPMTLVLKAGTTRDAQAVGPAAELVVKATDARGNRRTVTRPLTLRARPSRA